MARASAQSWLALRVAPPKLTRQAVGAAGLGIVLLVWWLATLGATAEERLVSPVILPSPGEVFRSFPVLLNERALLQSIAATLRRVLVGFGLAAIVGVPLGIVAGSWRLIESAGAPLALFGATSRWRRSSRSRSSGSASTRRRR
jgi:NitT/TauT family transport system permease protein